MLEEYDTRELKKSIACELNKVYPTYSELEEWFKSVETTYFISPKEGFKYVNACVKAIVAHADPTAPSMKK